MELLRLFLVRSRSTEMHHTAAQAKGLEALGKMARDFTATDIFQSWRFDQLHGQSKETSTHPTCPMHRVQFPCDFSTSFLANTQQPWQSRSEMMRITTTPFLHHASSFRGTAATRLVRDQPPSLFGGLGPVWAHVPCRDGLLFGPYVSDYLQI